MPIIDSSSFSKFDALIRINKAESLMSFIMATYNANNKGNKKEEVANRLKSSYELFRENIKGSNSGAGTYGQGNRDILSQFESHYTMGYEMGIWEDSDFTLTPLAIEVAKYNITVKEYIGIVFLNLFTYYDVNDEDTYHHFLYEVLNTAQKNNCINDKINKDIILESLPSFEKKNEQANLLFNYLIATDYFDKIDKDNMCLSNKWKGKADILISKCNLEYSNKTKEEAFSMASDKLLYARYVTKNEIMEERSVNDNENILNGGVNELYYGVPGVGKSYTINERINGAPFERVVFHPDYSYSDFVGQIMPRLIDNGNDDKKLTYEFVEGPFTKALMKAEENKESMQYLVIEEINRGNAAAIFGDLFQLLDRDDNGRSDYSITNFDISQKVYGNPNEEIRIPSNLTLLATMNTSDQNVFTLDTAFQRRWNMHYIKNDINNAKHANVNILNSNVTWGNFVNVINDEIAEYSLEMVSSEDKQLGAYFVSEADLKDVSFAEKALKYLWDDAFKLDRDKIFKDKFKSIGDLLGTYIDESNAGKDPIKAVMKDEIYKKMLNKTTDSSEDNEEVDYAVEE